MFWKCSWAYKESDIGELGVANITIGANHQKVFAKLFAKTFQIWFSNPWICSPVRDGRPLNDSEIAGMLIGLLLAGQHTSSTTSAWMGFFMAKDKALQEKCYAEQKAVCGEDLPALDLDQVQKGWSCSSNLH